MTKDQRFAHSTADASFDLPARDGHDRTAKGLSKIGAKDYTDRACTCGDHTDVECYGEGVGIAVRKGEDALREDLSKAIAAIRENGTYAEINDTYFPFDIYGGRPEGE